MLKQKYMSHFKEEPVEWHEVSRKVEKIVEKASIRGRSLNRRNACHHAMSYHVTCQSLKLNVLTFQTFANPFNKILVLSYIP